MKLFPITLLTAVFLSTVAEYFSIMGLISLFAAAPIPVAIMGISLGVAKLVAASWVFRNWSVAPSVLKYYLVVAVLILSFITSMGIFGYLSKAHSDQNLISGDTLAKLSLYDEKIKVAKENIETKRKTLNQLDETVSQVMSRSTTEFGAERAYAIRKSQAAERARILKEIDLDQKTISKLNDERAPIAAEIRNIEAELGPMKYIAALIYGDNPDTNLIERAIRWVILIIVFVFDPLAILLLIAANISIKQNRGEIITPVSAPEGDFTNFFDTTPNKQSEKETSKPAEEERNWSPEMYERASNFLHPYRKS